MPSCPNCGGSVPRGASFCPECGRAIGADTAVSAARSWWPPQPLAIIVVLLAAGGIFLLIGGEWAWGLVVLLAAGIVFLSQREAERRAARYTLAGFGARFSAGREAWAARSRGQLDIFRARREVAELEAERARGFYQLGHAVFEDDKERIKAAKEAVAAVVERIRGKEAEIESLIRATEERVHRAQAGFRPTEKMESQPEPPTENPPTPRARGRKKR